jgi:hypothetical protein
MSRQAAMPAKKNDEFPLPDMGAFFETTIALYYIASWNCAVRRDHGGHVRFGS